MTDAIADHARQISELLETRMRIKGRSLDQQIHKSGRRLPRRIKRDAKRVAQAATLTQNPKLARMVDPAEVDGPAANVIAHLKGIDPHEVMKDRILITLAKIAAFVIVVFIAVVWFAHSRGLV